MADQRREPNQRPSPDALLAKASKEESRAGRLKIFLGAAPGVGKTYEMLLEARARLKEGKDVVIGVVETHGRKETEALTEGLETIPRRRVDYKDREMDEMDIDAILARRPKLVLVDELAHRLAYSRDGVPHDRRHPEKHTVELAPRVAEGVGGRSRPTRGWSAAGARLQGSFLELLALSAKWAFWLIQGSCG